ncbi:MAG TPA: SH3 domain-containing protein [Chryseolinea sp.]|nr:SH3 domain-containing protein [Chryseolinea sp.]
MKNYLLITSVLVFVCLLVSTSMAQLPPGDIAVCATSPDAAKCVGSADCKACKNCSACAHCKENDGKCGVCKKSERSARTKGPIDDNRSSGDTDYTQVEWSSKSLKPAATNVHHLDVHSGPGASFKVVGEVSSEDPLIIIGEREGWYKIVVRHADLVGFVEVAHVEIVQ